MPVLLYICCMFSEHLFIRTAMEGCFCIASHISFSRSSEENVRKKSATKGKNLKHLYTENGLLYMYY